MVVGSGTSVTTKTFRKIGLYFDLVNNCNLTAGAVLSSLSDQTYFPLYLGLKPARNPVKFTLARTRRALSCLDPLKLKLSSQQIRAVSFDFILK